MSMFKLQRAKEGKMRKEKGKEKLQANFRRYIKQYRCQLEE